MRIRVGDIVESEFGRGKIVAITKKWIIHEDGNGGEHALYREYGEFWVPAEFDEPSGGDGEAELPVEREERWNDA